MLVIPVLAQENIQLIPSWVKSVAGYWSEDKIDDSEFIEALEFLIDNRVINLGGNVVVDMSEQEIKWEERYFTLKNQVETKIDTLEKEHADALHTQMIKLKGEQIKLNENHGIAYNKQKEEHKAMIEMIELSDKENMKELEEKYKKLIKENSKLKLNQRLD